MATQRTKVSTPFIFFIKMNKNMYTNKKQESSQNICLTFH